MNVQQQIAGWPDPPITPSGQPYPSMLLRPRSFSAGPGRDLDKIFGDLHRVLKRLRFAKLRDVSQHPHSWNEWLSIFFAWARLCFRPADYGDFDLEMFVDAEDVEHGALGVGHTYAHGSVVLHFVLGNDGLPDELKWYSFLARSPEPYDVTRYELCLCTVLRLPPHSLQNLKDDYGVVRYDSTEAPSPFESLVSSLVAICETTSCRFGLATDGSKTLCLKLASDQLLQPGIRYCDYRVVHCSDVSLTHAIMAMMYDLSASLVDQPPRLYGAPDRVLSYNLPPHDFSDFDHYQLANSAQAYELFLQWKESACESALSSLPTVGSTIPILRCNVVSTGRGGKFIPLRSNDPICPLPAATEQLYFARRRPRNEDIAQRLRDHERLVFKVSVIKQQGRDYWSQVYFGTLVTQSGSVVARENVCLKLFDERFSEVPDRKTYDTEPWGYGENVIHFADMMLRREESAYERLKEYQGGPIPWCYGFHEFVVPDGQRVLGMLLEAIPGKSLQDIIAENHSIWTFEDRVAFLKRVRQTIKILSHAGVYQNDWHAKQILCVDNSLQGQHGGSSGTRANVAELDMVLFDFAFATQVWGSEPGALLPENHDITHLKHVLLNEGMEAALKAAGWDERDACEA